MNETMKDDAAKGSARRRLLRGVFAAPAALTLYSGSVAAASVSCLAKQLEPAVNRITSPPSDGLAATQLVRVPLFTLGTAPNTATFVRQASIAMLNAPGGSYLSASQAQCVGIAGNSVKIFPTGNDRYVAGELYADPIGATATGLAAVRVDETGRVVGVLNYPASGANTALFTSCWTSLGGLDPFRLA